MKINKIKIHNWRSIKDIEIDFQDMMIFIGQNNHGKSNILSALLFFFGEIPCSDLDFNRGSNELYVEVTFSNLDDADKITFKKYVTVNNTIKVKKQIVKGESSEYHGYCQIPNEDWLKEEKIAEYNNKASINNTPLAEFILESGRVTKEMVRKAQEEYISRHKEALSFNYEIETSPFLGAKTVAQGIFGEVYFIPAVKDAGEEFAIKGKSTFNKLLSNVINDMSNNSQPYMAAKEKIAELTKALNKNIVDGSTNEDRPEQIISLEQTIEEELKKWNTKIEIEITPPNIDEALKLGTSVWVDDGVPTDINRKGNGLQRALIFALIKSWAKVSKDAEARLDEEMEKAGIDKPARRASSSSYFIFEEPELYLHPQAQKELEASLKELSEMNSQVLITTHSSFFVNLKHYKSICIVYKENAGSGTKSVQCSGELFSEAEEIKNFNLAYWINPDRGELFFAKKVILVEGQTEKMVLSYLANNLGIYRYDYSIIECGNKDNIQFYIHLLNKFNLPYIVVYDKDHQAGKTPQGIDAADKATSLIEEKIDRTLGSSVILENDIEEEIGIAGGSSHHKPYVALMEVSREGFSLRESFKEKIETIFS